MIRIISGWSNPGGSTVAFINLTNALNEAGYETIFMGPHNWHLGKCNAGHFVPGKKVRVSPEDTLIIHFNNKFTQRPPVKGFFLSSHEQDIFPLRNINYSIFDKIHYVSDHQRRFHMVQHPYFIIPNIMNKIDPKNLDEKIAGIIGSIDRNKAVDVSIKKALKDGCKLVLIYGMISDNRYWQTNVQPLIDGKKVIYKGYCDNRQEMYDSFSDLYFSSVNECMPYVLGEAQMAEKKIHTLNGKNYVGLKYEFDKDKIVENWIKELEV